MTDQAGYAHEEVVRLISYLHNYSLLYPGLVWIHQLAIGPHVVYSPRDPVHDLQCDEV